MTWYCEDCKAECNVLVGIPEFEMCFDMPMTDIKKCIEESEALLRCSECDSTRIVWK